MLTTRHVIWIVSVMLLVQIPVGLFLLGTRTWTSDSCADGSCEEQLNSIHQMSPDKNKQSTLTERIVRLDDRAKKLPELDLLNKQNKMIEDEQRTTERVSGIERQIFEMVDKLQKRRNKNRTNTGEATTTGKTDIKITDKIKVVKREIQNSGMLGLGENTTSNIVGSVGKVNVAANDVRTNSSSSSLKSKLSTVSENSLKTSKRKEKSDPKVDKSLSKMNNTGRRKDISNVEQITEHDSGIKSHTFVNNVSQISTNSANKSLKKLLKKPAHKTSSAPAQDLYSYKEYTELIRRRMDVSRTPVDDLDPTVALGEGPACVKEFQTKYKRFCESVSLKGDESVSNRSLEFVGNGTEERARLEELNWTHCPCVPPTLVGLTHIDKLMSKFSDKDYAGVEPISAGGSWRPSSCMARQRVAVIIPYRDRKTHLRALLRTLHPMLQRQMLHYTIFVVEQELPREAFNKGMLMNSGFSEISSREKFDCFVFHDVDLLPEDDRNMYTCTKVPRHVGVYINKWNYRLYYDRMFGGATAFTFRQFKMVNGFSNEFWGWGGEDDDMLKRVENQNLGYIRYPMCVSRYSMVRHSPDKTNPQSPVRVLSRTVRPDVYATVGLSNLQYTLVSYHKLPYYTQVLITLPPAPADFLQKANFAKDIDGGWADIQDQPLQQDN